MCIVTEDYIHSHSTHSRASANFGLQKMKRFGAKATKNYGRLECFTATLGTDLIIIALYLGKNPASISSMG